MHLKWSEAVLVDKVAYRLPFLPGSGSINFPSVDLVPQMMTETGFCSWLLKSSGSCRIRIANTDILLLAFTGARAETEGGEWGGGGL